MHDDARSFHTARQLPHPPAAVYAAFADAAALAAWWGPAGFSNRFELFEFQPGGRWVFEMIGPDGQRFANRNRFVELVADARVVVRHESAPLFTLQVTLTPEADGTRLDWLQVFDDAAVAAAVAAIVRPANEQNLDRLSARLAAAPGR